MKDKLLYAFGVIVGLVACIPLWFVRAIEIIHAVLWVTITFIMLGLCELDKLLEMALSGEEPEGDAIDDLINEMITGLKRIKKIWKI